MGAFSQERQGLWLPKDDLKDPPRCCSFVTSTPSFLHSTTAERYVRRLRHRLVGPVLDRAPRMISLSSKRPIEVAQLSLPQPNRLLEGSFVHDESSVSTADVAVIPSQGPGSNSQPLAVLHRS